MSRARWSSGALSNLISGALGGEDIGKSQTCETAAQVATVAGGSDHDMVSLPPKGHLITGLDAEFVSEVFRDHNLSLCAHSVSHTGEYNYTRLADSRVRDRETAGRGCLGTH
jgi:hypothetical protein